MIVNKCGMFLRLCQLVLLRDLLSFGAVGAVGAVDGDSALVRLLLVVVGGKGIYFSCWLV